MRNFGHDAKVVRVQNAAAAGTSVLAGSTVDVSGFDGVCFIYGVGALTATQTTKLKAGGGAASDGSDKSDLAGSGTPQGANLADGDGNKLLVLDIPNPQQRYITPSLVRGTANAVVDFGIAVLYKSNKGPVTTDTTVASGATVVVVAPSTGTAG